MAPSSSCHVKIKHDVFISFRGTDIRKGLLSHLNKALCMRHIDTYVDEKLERGDEISSSLLTAIEESQILLVIFSKDYASSKWCLEELAKMIECMERNKRVLLPVFFNVDPSHVRNQLGEYGDALAKHEETLKENILKVQSWRSALNKAGHLSGFHYPTNYEDESDLVNKIVEDILEKLSKFGTSESNGLVGIDENIAQIESILLMESCEVHFAGIWGMGGIGKTTIARAVFDKYSLQYDGCCILNVREELEKQELRHLRERLISELLEEESLHTSSTSKARYINSAIRRLRQKKVFIVLDDVNTFEQLKKLVCEGINFGPGSRVIITSRDRHVLTSGGVNQIHEVKKMDPRDSLKLFCLNAFNECHPKTGYEKLSQKIVKIAQGNPLALEVLGSYFHSTSSIETWRCALNKIKKYPHEEIQRVLRFSFDELHDVEKKTFLDIAFFFKKEDKDYVTRQLDSWGFYGTYGIEVLQHKALITISNDNRIQMHDLIREMGLEIVRQESPEYPERRSRLRDREDVYHVLRNNLGADKVEAMQIVVASKIADLLPLNVNTLHKKMPRLRFLKFYYPLHAELCMPPSCVKALLQDIADSKRRGFNISNKLEDLPQFKSWHNANDLVNSSSKSEELIETPGLSKESNLERDRLSECKILCDADETILSLEKQVALLLSGHEELKNLASEIHIKCVHYMFVHGCSDPENFSSTSKLSIIQPRLGIEILNSSIGYRGNVKNLNVAHVDDEKFKNVPNNLFSLRCVDYLKLSSTTRQDTRKPKLHILFDGIKDFPGASGLPLLPGDTWAKGDTWARLVWFGERDVFLFPNIIFNKNHVS